MNAMEEINLTPEEQSFYDALLKLKKTTAQKYIELLNSQFNLTGSDTGAQAEDEEKEVVKKTSFKLVLKDKGDETKTKIKCVRVFQSIFPELPLIQVMSLFVIGEINKEFSSEKEALEVANKFNDIGNGIKVEVI